MRSYFILTASLVAVLTCLAGCAATQAEKAASPATPELKAHPILSQKLPRMDGSHLRVILEQVDFGPGAFAPVHTHPCPVIGYVTEGAIQSKVKGVAEQVYTKDQAFFEAPNGVHEIARNGSQTRPAHLLAIHICDKDVPLSLPVPPVQKDKMNATTK